MTNGSLGGRVRELRLSRGLSLRQLAKGTGLSPSFLSAVENDRANVSLTNAQRVGEFLGVSLDQLAGGASAFVYRHVRRGCGKKLRNQSTGVENELLLEEITHRMLPVAIRFEPGAKSAEAWIHEGDEFCYLLQGEITIQFEGKEPVQMAQGDSLYFKGTYPHTYVNHSDQPSILLAVTSPPAL